MYFRAAGKDALIVETKIIIEYSHAHLDFSSCLFTIFYVWTRTIDTSHLPCLRIIRLLVLDPTIIDL